MPPIVIAAAISAGGALGGAALGASAAKKASQTQLEATNQAATLQKQAADEALGFQKEMWTKEQENLAPWLAAGKSSLSDLVSARDELTRPFGMKDFQADPGYEFRRTEGMRDVGRMQGAGSLSGKTLKDAMTFNSGLASGEYSNAYNRFNADQSNRFNRLAAIAGIGQTATSQLNAAGSNFSNNASNITLSTGQSLGDLMTQAGNARASGYMGSANAWASGLSNTGSNLSNLYMMKKLGLF